MNSDRYFSKIPCSKGHVGYRRIPDNACFECMKMTSKGKYKNMPGGLKLFKHYCHPDDIEKIEAFIKALLLDRGYY